MQRAMQLHPGDSELFGAGCQAMTAVGSAGFWESAGDGDAMRRLLAALRANEGSVGGQEAGCELVASLAAASDRAAAVKLAEAGAIHAVLRAMWAFEQGAAEYKSVGYSLAEPPPAGEGAARAVVRAAVRLESTARLHEHGCSALSRLAEAGGAALTVEILEAGAGARAAAALAAHPEDPAVVVAANELLRLLDVQAIIVAAKLRKDVLGVLHGMQVPPQFHSRRSR